MEPRRRTRQCLSKTEKASYLLVDPACEHSSGERLDGDDSLSHSHKGPSISHHAPLFLKGEGGSHQSQVFCIPEEQRENLKNLKNISSGK